MNVIAELKTDEGKFVGVFMASPKQFKTGSRGFYAVGKVEIDGKRYQTQIQLVEIGSKPGSKAAAAAVVVPAVVAVDAAPKEKLPDWLRTFENEPQESQRKGRRGTPRAKG